MKKFVCVLTLIAALTFGGTCSAKDVFFSHWNTENADVYVMDETFNTNLPNGLKGFSVSTKKVRDGKTIQITKWEYFQNPPTNQWCYRNNLMDAKRMNVVIPTNGLFEFCMKLLGWQYSTYRDEYYQ
ncbi:MAG: hypothetical protein K6G55_00750 [Selenomonadaceae bacterium]|nr:hypothetical protein [Selenomonadaceae bacterium]